METENKKINSEIINKIKISSIVYEKLQSNKIKIDYIHIVSIVRILFEEMVESLKNGDQIRIANFATFELNKMPPRKHFDYQKKIVKETKGNNVLRIKFLFKIRKLLTSMLDFKQLLADHYKDTK